MGGATAVCAAEHAGSQLVAPHRRKKSTCPFDRRPLAMTTKI